MTAAAAAAAADAASAPDPSPPSGAPALADVVAAARSPARAAAAVARLARLARVPSSSTQFAHRAACARAAHIVRDWAAAAAAGRGGSARATPELVPVGYQELASGERHDLPPVVLAEFGDGDPSKCTVLVYANYDVRDVPTDLPAPAGSAPGTPAAAGAATAGDHHPQAAIATAPAAAAPNGYASVRNTNGVAGSDAPAAAGRIATNATKLIDIHPVPPRDNDNGDHGAPGAAEIPFTEVDGVLHGTGVASVKAPLVAWLCAVEAYHALSVPLPINLKLIVEGMKMSSSECLVDLVKRETGRRGFLHDVDYIVTVDGAWPTPRKPSLTTGTRGLASFEIQVVGGTRALDSGEFGGCIAEPMTDLIQLLAEVTKLGHGRIGVHGCGPDAIPPASPEEVARLAAIDIDLKTMKKAAGDVPGLVGGEDKMAVLLGRSRMPSISIHGIEGAYDGPGVNTIIPNTISGKFTIRLGPGQDAQVVTKLVTDALEARFKTLNSPNDIGVSGVSFNAWNADPASLLYIAASSAVTKVHGVPPDLVRSGGSLFAMDCFLEYVGSPALVFPLAGLPVLPTPSTDKTGAIPNDEPMLREQFVSGIAMLITLLDEIARMDAATPEGQARRSQSLSRAVGKDGTRTSGPLTRIRELWNGLA